MSVDLLARAQKQADRSSSPVRASARLRIARVQSAVDPGRARITFEMALDEIRSQPGRERDFFFEQAQQIAAAFAPDLLREIPSVHCLPDGFHAEKLVSIMLQHGHIDSAFEYVVQCDAPSSFPFGYTANLMNKLDDERKLTVLRRAIDVWRATQDNEPMRTRGTPKEGRRSGRIRSFHFRIGLYRSIQMALEHASFGRGVGSRPRYRAECNGAARYGTNVGWLWTRHPIHFRP